MHLARMPTRRRLTGSRIYIFSCRADDGLIELNQVAARVGEYSEHDGSSGRRRLGEHHTFRTQARELTGKVTHLERGQGNPLLEHRLLKALPGGVGIRLERQLQVARRFRRRDRDPSILTDRKILALHKTENVRIESDGLLLIIHHDARQLDAHASLREWFSGVS